MYNDERINEIRKMIRDSSKGELYVIYGLVIGEMAKRESGSLNVPYHSPGNSGVVDEMSDWKKRHTQSNT